MFEKIDVKQARQKLGLTQAGLASLLGVDQGTVSNWENGKNAPSGSARRLMARLLEEKATAA